jgi:ABC-type Zn uptake system ZnuABC Zn-binding protein ZnuA
VLRLALLCLCLAATGCGASASAGPDPRLQVVATTTQVADLARHVAGDRAAVRGLLAPNSDPHDYEVRPSDLDGLAGADVVMRSGGDLDAWLGGAIESAGGAPRVVDLIRSVRTRAGAGGVDPHWWQDPRNAMAAVRAIRDALSAADPTGAPAYGANAARYLATLRGLDRRIAACIATIPRADRRLVTTHDALGYYARRYGIALRGAVIPSLSTRGQASAGETAALVALVRRERIRAIFAEQSVSPKVERAIAREAGARLGDPLYADTLGPRGSAGATYAGSLRANTAAIVRGLEGSCRP